MDGLEWKTPIKMDDLGGFPPPCKETAILGFHSDFVHQKTMGLLKPNQSLDANSGTFLDHFSDPQTSVVFPAFVKGDHPRGIQIAKDFTYTKAVYIKAYRKGKASPQMAIITYKVQHSCIFCYVPETFVDSVSDF